MGLSVVAGPSGLAATAVGVSERLAAGRPTVTGGFSRFLPPTEVGATDRQGLTTPPRSKTPCSCFRSPARAAASAVSSPLSACVAGLLITPRSTR